MQEADIRAVARIVLDEQEERLRTMEDALVRRATAASLAAWGVDIDDIEEVRELKLDRIHNRKWRKSVETVQKVSLRTAVAVLVPGLLGLIWLGIKAKFGNG